MYECPICHNVDPKYIGIRNGKPYCRRCIKFQGEHVVDDGERRNHLYISAYLKYPLSKEQSLCSDAILKAFKNKQNVLVHAVCGAGKTELVYKVIEYAISQKMTIGFAIPRKDVVVEIYRRLKTSFSSLDVTYVVGGFTDNLRGEIICLTTHQLYRYEHYFDLLIMDEIDAFPYKDNPVLIEMFKRSVRGNYVLMSATPTNSVLKEFEKENHVTIKLFKRYHGFPLPVPKIVIKKSVFKYVELINLLTIYLKKGAQVFVFVPTIDKCEEVYNVICRIVKKGDYVHSKVLNRNERIDAFRKGEIRFLVTTAVLERGVTVKNLQVIIFEADHKIYNKAALIQISGRAGRVIDCPTGDVIFLAEKITKEMAEAIKEIEGFNNVL